MTIINLGAMQPPESLTMPSGTGLSNVMSDAMKYGSLTANTGNPWATGAGVAFGAIKGIVDTNKERKNIADKDYAAQRTYAGKVEQLNVDGSAMVNANAAGTGYFTSMYAAKKGGKIITGDEFTKSDSLPPEVIELVIRLSIDVSKLRSQPESEDEEEDEIVEVDNPEEEETEIKKPQFTISYHDGGEVPEQFRDGGQMNVIPAGVLHAHNNNIGDKGIPVVTKSDEGEVKKIAEIEKEEIIFTLDVTKFLEGYAEKLDSGDITPEELVEVGKRLQEEITQNTIDHSKKLMPNG